MSRYFLTLLFTGTLVAADTPVAPKAAEPEAPPVAPIKAKEGRVLPPLALRKLVQASILMLEAKAYEQFIRAYISDTDRPRFEKQFEKDGRVDYAEWGAQKADRLLGVLRSLAEAEVLVEPGRVCYFFADDTRPALSFISVRGMWLIENSTKCKRPKPKDAAAPAEAQP